MSLEEYKHLWDGSEPGWSLQKIDHIEWSIKFQFADSGPTKSEILGLRKLIDAFHDASMSEVLKQLRGRDSYTLPFSLGNIKMRMIMEAANKLGLHAKAESIDLGGYLPISCDGDALLIDDDALCAEVTKRMLAAGVPVTEVHVD